MTRLCCMGDATSRTRNGRVRGVCWTRVLVNNFYAVLGWSTYPSLHGVCKCWWMANQTSTDQLIHLKCRRALKSHSHARTYCWMPGSTRLSLGHIEKWRWTITLILRSCHLLFFFLLLLELDLMCVWFFLVLACNSCFDRWVWAWSWKRELRAASQFSHRTYSLYVCTLHWEANTWLEKSCPRSGQSYCSNPPTVATP